MLVARIFSLFLVLLFLSGCAGWVPSGARGYEDVVTNSDLDEIKKSNSRALLVVDVGDLSSVIEENAEGFAGSACYHGFKFYPELYALFVEKMLGKYSVLSVSDSISDGEGYDVVVRPDIGEIKWAAAGMSSNAAAVKVLLNVMAGGVSKEYSAFQVASSTQERVVNGCGDSSALAEKAARKALEFSVNRLVKEISGEAITNSRNDGYVVDVEKQRMLLSLIQSNRGAAVVGRQDELNSMIIKLGIAATTAHIANKGSGDLGGGNVSVINSLLENMARVDSSGGAYSLGQEVDGYISSCDQVGLNRWGAEQANKVQALMDNQSSQASQCDAAKMTLGVHQKVLDFAYKCSPQMVNETLSAMDYTRRQIPELCSGSVKSESQCPPGQPLCYFKPVQHNPNLGKIP